MASRKPKKDRRKGDRLPKRLFKRALGPVVPPGSQVLYEPAGREKMSEVLEEFIEPYRDSADTFEAYRKLLSVALVAWNAALLPEGKRRAMIDEMIAAGLSSASAEDQALARDLIEAMVRRKVEHFAANRRAIVSFEVTDRGDDYYLAVASTL